MKHVKTIPSKSGGEPHKIHQDADGKFSCSCAAGQNGKECWALKQHKGLARMRFK